LNPAAEQLFGYSQEEALGKNLHRLVIPDEHLFERYCQGFKHFQLTGKGNLVGETIELKAKHKDGRKLDVEVSLSALWFRNEWHAVGIVRDISERKRLEEENKRKNAELRHLAITDVLTNAYNRRYFMQRLEEEIERSKRADRKFSLIMLDIDRFKSINDRFGHNVGDLVLKSTVELIKNRIRKIDILARWGGEEFVILLPDTTVKNAVRLAEELRESLSRIDIPYVGHVTASFGVAGYCPGDTVDTLLQRADNHMYEAKAAGRNCVRYDEEECSKRENGSR
jgi:diguanylate cyclase (GGDEF)-like protein/PAS domain S-box-containing protein